MITFNPFFKVNSWIGIRTRVPVCADGGGSERLNSCALRATSAVARRQTSNNAEKTFNLDIFFLQIRDGDLGSIGHAQPPGDRAVSLGLLEMRPLYTRDMI